jgi:hypothetical protein
MDDYEKLDVEDAYRARGGVALRLPMTYGAHDRQRREEFILRRVRGILVRVSSSRCAGTWRIRRRIPTPDLKPTIGP